MRDSHLDELTRRFISSGSTGGPPDIAKPLEAPRNAAEPPRPPASARSILVSLAVIVVASALLFTLYFLSA